ncbi:MAG: membrane dipeptidase [Desulfuromonadales bacterium]|nr:membrane dipeptidase [Desulfuromonadales bacterium]
MTTCSPDADIPVLRPVFDAHVDIVYALRQTDAPPFDASPFAADRLAAGGVRVLTSALYCADAYNGPGAAGHLAELIAADDRFLGNLPLIRTRSDLEMAWSDTGPPGRLRLLENADALLEFGVKAACAAGIVTVGLTHVGRNRLADGNAVADPGGLTPAGRQLLPALAAAGLVLDVAHLAPPGFREVLEVYPGALACSHTGLRRFRDVPRNLDETQLAALLGRGGMVGLAFAPGLLATTPDIDLDEVFRQLDWLVQRFGAEQVGLGSDFGGFEGFCRGLEDHGRLPALAARMQQAGYPVAAIAGIMGENWARYYSRVLSSA